MTKGIGTTPPGTVVQTGPFAGIVHPATAFCRFGVDHMAQSCPKCEAEAKRKAMVEDHFALISDKLGEVEEAMRMAKLAEGLAYAAGLRINELQDKVEALAAMVEDQARELAAVRAERDADPSDPDMTQAVASVEEMEQARQKAKPVRLVDEYDDVDLTY